MMLAIPLECEGRCVICIHCYFRQGFHRYKTSSNRHDQNVHDHTMNLNETEVTEFNDERKLRTSMQSRSSDVTQFHRESMNQDDNRLYRNETSRVHYNINLLFYKTNVLEFNDRT